MGWALYFYFLWSKALSFDDAGNFIAGYSTLWSDWAAHFTMGTAMAYRDLFLNESPLLLGASFRYPFGANFISALLIRQGATLITAYLLPSFLCSLLLLGALYFFFRRTLRSDMGAVFSSCIFLLNGGLGVFFYLKQALGSETPWRSLLVPAQSATKIPQWDIYWMSVISSMIIPQRAFLMGFPLALLCLIFIYRVIESGAPFRPHVAGLCSAVLLWGILPVFHTHSFVAISLCIGSWVVGDVVCASAGTRLRRAGQWLIVFSAAALVAVPLLGRLGLFSGEGNSMIRWHPGWYADGLWDWIKFWILNWGATPFVAVAGAILWIHQRPLRADRIRRYFFLAPFAVLFVLMNLILFQPWEWDNTKILAWVAVAVSGMAGFWLARQKKALAIPMFILMTASGFIDAARLQFPSLNAHRMYSKEEWDLAGWVRANTPVDSLWLTAPYTNNWLFNLTGRKVFMTYEGWIWTHGYVYAPVKKTLLDLFANPRDAALYETNGVGYIVSGPAERKDLIKDPAAFDASFDVVHRTEKYIIYAVRKPLTPTPE